MNKVYSDWIKKHVPKDPFGVCKEVSQMMAEAFPELTRVRGDYYDIEWGERSHWWLETLDGEVVDPTASQFPTNGTGVYIPWNESYPEPTRMCMNCGGLVYDGSTFCSPACLNAAALE